MTRQGCFKALSSVIVFAGFLSTTIEATEFVVKIRGNSKNFNSKVMQLRHDQHLSILDAHAGGSLIKVNIDEATIPQKLPTKLMDLLKDPNVEYVVPNVKLRAFGVPSDPQFSQQWSHQVVNSLSAWEVHSDAQQVVVAVIDTGVDYKHEDLAANIWINPGEIPGNGVDDDGNGFVDDAYGWDFFDNDNDPMDETSNDNPGHGTHCAGIVGAVGNNSTGIVGMAPHVKLMTVRYLGADGSGDLMNSAKSIDYAVQNGAHIISASWGANIPESFAKPIIEAVERANAEGVLFIAAAGNEGVSNDRINTYPANAKFDNVISVGASSPADGKPEWSNFGKLKVHLAAPGQKILSTLPGNTYSTLSGTSMATPMVSGLAALMLAHYENGMYPLEVRSLLQTTGATIEMENACNCRIDAHAALTAVSNSTLTVVPASASIAPEEQVQFSAFGTDSIISYEISDENVASIDANGLLTGINEGSTKVTIRDSQGRTAKSLDINVVKPKTSLLDQCPVEDETLCMWMCYEDPELPWCE